MQPSNSAKAVWQSDANEFICTALDRICKVRMKQIVGIAKPEGRRSQAACKMASSLFKSGCNEAPRDTCDIHNCSQEAVILSLISSRMYTAPTKIPQVACYNMLILMITSADVIVLCRDTAAHKPAEFMNAGMALKVFQVISNRTRIFRKRAPK